MPFFALMKSPFLTASAKLQITQLTDEIALKFEDNLQQQMEISQLINMVVELQRKQKLVKYSVDVFHWLSLFHIKSSF